MKLKKPGTNTSSVEVSHVSPNGVWLFLKDKEYFLPYDEFPWFKDATIAQIHSVRFLHHRHLYWKDLDVDLDLASLEQLEKYPLKFCQAV